MARWVCVPAPVAPSVTMPAGQPAQGVSADPAGLTATKRSAASPAWPVRPKLRLVRQAVPALTWCFVVLGQVLFWLLQGERDRGAEKVEGLPLGAGGLGEHRHGDGGAGEPGLVAGQGGQVGEQAAEAAVGAACGIALV